MDFIDDHAQHSAGVLKQNIENKSPREMVLLSLFFAFAITASKWSSCRFFPLANTASKIKDSTKALPVGFFALANEKFLASLTDDTACTKQRRITCVWKRAFIKLRLNDKAAHVLCATCEKCKKFKEAFSSQADYLHICSAKNDVVMLILTSKAYHTCLSESFR